MALPIYMQGLQATQNGVAQQTDAASALKASLAPAPAAPGLQPGTVSNVGYNGNIAGSGENYANSALDYYGAGNIPGVSNNQQQAYQQFQNQVPADTSAYYDNAVRTSANDLNTQMAARGSFGSSAAIGQLSNASTNIRAQQAHDSAQYGLQRAGVAGQLAGGADSQSTAASQNQLAWTQGLGSLAFQGQAAGANRYQQGFDNSMGLANQLAGIEGASYSAANAADQGAYSDAINAQLGKSTQGLSYASDQATRTDNINNQWRDAVVGTLKAVAKAS